MVSPLLLSLTLAGATALMAQPRNVAPAQDTAAWTLAIDVRSAGTERVTKAVEVELEPGQLLTAKERPLALVEIDPAGEIIDRHVPFQLDPDEIQPTSQATEGRRLLTFLMAGKTPANATRTFLLQPAAEPPTAEALVQVEEVPEYEGFPAFRITTPAATYYYHVGGSGFASILDRDGRDWISHHPTGGFEGNYRGIPNIAPPEFHPGTGKGKKPSRLIRSGPLRASILSETEDGAWRVMWDIFPEYAAMTLLTKGPEPYWILYEGTPGGSFDTQNDYWVKSSGERVSVAPNDENNRWNGRLPAPQWVYFGDDRLQRVLYLALHEPDDFPDEFWHRGSGGMTVFGFGRGPRPQWRYLETLPAHLTIGFVESKNFEEAKRQIESAWRPVEVNVSDLAPPTAR